MVCPKCGSPTGKNEKYCSNCGYPVTGGDVQKKKKMPTGLLIFIVAAEMVVLAAVAGFLFVNIRKNHEVTETEQSSDQAASGEKKDYTEEPDTKAEAIEEPDTDKEDAEQTDADEEDTEKQESDKEAASDKSEEDTGEADKEAKAEPEPEPEPEPKAEAEPEPAPASASVQTTSAQAALITDPVSIDSIRRSYKMLSTDKVLNATASTTIHQDKVQSPPINILDGDQMTNWQEGAEGSGIGEYAEFNFKQEYTVGALTLKLGNWKTDRYFYGNNRPRKLTFSMDSQSWQVEFPDEWKEFAIQFSNPVTTDSLKITIDDVYRGSDWDDTVITDICVWHQ